MVQREGDRICLSDAHFKKQPAVCLTTGIVSYCQLIELGTTLTAGNYKLKQLLLCPFGIEYERAVAFIGGALDVTKYVQWATKLLQCLVKLERLVIAGSQKMARNKGNSGLIEVLLSFNLSLYPCKLVK